MQTDTLYFCTIEQADRFVAAVNATGEQAQRFIDDDSDGDGFPFGVTYTGHEVSWFGQAPYNAVGLQASRFTREE